MKVALTVWEGHISPLFDATRMLLIADIEGNRVTDRRMEPFDCASVFSRAARLEELGVDTLICGGISRMFASPIEACQILIIPFAAGAVEDVLAAYLRGRHLAPRYRMPGCMVDRSCGHRILQNIIATKPHSTQEANSMKIAITSTGPTLDDMVETRFGRCPYFLIVDTDTMALEAIDNPNRALGGGAGIQSAQMMASKGVAAVLTGTCGPNAFQVFGAAGLEVITGVQGPVREAVAQFKAGALNPSDAPNVESHFGMGGGMAGGRCGGRGMGGGGRGMGGGGRGMGGGGRGMGGMSGGRR